MYMPDLLVTVESPKCPNRIQALSGLHTRQTMMRVRDRRHALYGGER